MEKLDLRKQLKHLYAPSAKQVELVDVPTFRFAMVDGCIEAGVEPGSSPEFQEAVGALYGIAYTLKFMSKLRAEDPVDYPVMPLEGLWSTREGEFDMARRVPWPWTLMILQPDHVTEAMFGEAIDRVRRKRDTPALSRVRLESFHEGLCVQVMHIGAYAEEPATMERMHAFARENGYTFRGRHHEIYLGDPRRSAPERLKTVLRHPAWRCQ